MEHAFLLELLLQKLLYAKMNLEHCQTSKMEDFAKTVHGWKFYFRNSILDISQGSEYAWNTNSTNYISRQKVQPMKGIRS